MLTRPHLSEPVSTQSVASKVSRYAARETVPAGQPTATRSAALGSMLGVSPSSAISSTNPTTR